MLAASVELHGTNLSGEVADVDHAGFCIQGKPNGLVVIGCNHDHVAARFAHRWYRSLVQGVSSRRITAVSPVHRAGVKVEFEIDGFGKPGPEDFDATFTDGCVQRRAEDPAVIAVRRALLRLVQQPPLFVDRDADALVAQYPAVGFGGRDYDLIAQVGAVEPHAAHGSALPVRPIQSSGRPGPR